MRPSESLRASALTLGLAGGIEYGLQLATPIILVRYLDVTAFAQYRLLWLLAGTVLGIAPAFMPQALFYFLPRAPREQKGRIIGNTLVYLLAAGAAVALATSGWSPLLPALASGLFFQTHGISALFLGLWVVASMLDVLPTADGRARWQAGSTITLAVVRTALLIGAAMLGSGILWIVIALAAAAIIKLSLLAWYIRSNRDGGKMSWSLDSLKTQLAYSLPFAFGNALFLMRMQADQWVVASMLSAALYATFSIASVASPVATLIRMPVYNAMMPRLNGAHARGDLAEIARLIARSNGATAMLLLPVAGGLFTTAPELVRLVYTSRYQGAAPIMQVYTIGMMMTVFAVGHVLPAIEKGRFAVQNNGCCLLLSVILSILGVTHWGAIGAAFGSVSTLAISELWSVQVVAHTLGMRMHRLLDWHALGPTALATAVAMAGVPFLAGHVSGGLVAVLAAKSVLYLVLFLTCFFLAGGRRQLVLLSGQRS